MGDRVLALVPRARNYLPDLLPLNIDLRPASTFDVLARSGNQLAAPPIIGQYGGRVLTSLTL